MNPAGEHRPCNPPLDPRGQVAVVTGGAGGIGRALGRRLHDAGASVVVLADLDPGWTVDVAAHVASEAEGPGTVEGVALDVTDEAATARLVAELTERHGSIDLWCANAGVATGSGIDADLTTWQRVWEVNVLGALHAARVLMPLWQERNRGHLMITASAAGLLTNLGDAPYSVTKHAAVGLAEWLAITHGGDGIGVSCLCPQGVRTPMLFGEDDEGLPRTSPGPSAGGIAGSLAARAVHDQRILEPDEVAAIVVEALAAGEFLILPHDEVSGYERNRAADHGRWIRGMRRLQASLGPP
jgi:NAD(P)-dependent dehydrogenase (short-subunit alcohol dehydrogenase family)